MYHDRRAAGKELAQLLKRYCNGNCLVLGIPRGGVIVASEIARSLEAPLDIIIPRKVGAPFNPEIAIGAVAQDGTMIADQRLISLLNIDEAELAEEVSIVQDEIMRRMEKYRGAKPFPALNGKVVIIVDDGIATGYTVKAALKSVKRQIPEKLILAVPVAPKDTVENLAEEVDEIVCPLMPEDFYAVGQFYESFEQNTDEEVIKELRSLP